MRKPFLELESQEGTLISSALKPLLRNYFTKNIIPQNGIFILFIFPDGDNWSTDDTKTLSANFGSNILLPASNVFSYGQVESRYGSGQFYKDLQMAYGDNNDKVTLSKIKGRHAILDSIKDFLGRGK